MDQLACDTARQAVGVDGYLDLRRQPEPAGEVQPARTQGTHGQGLRYGIVKQEATKVDRQIRFQARQHHLKNTRQVLPLAGRVGNVLQQAQAADLRAQLALRLLNLREHLIECVGEQVKFIGARARRSHGVVVALRHRAGGLREGLDGPQQPILQAPGYQIGERQRDAAHHDDNEGVQLEARIHGLEVGLDEQNTKLLGSFLNRLKADQGRTAEAIARAGMGGQTFRRESLRIHRENLAAHVVQRGRDDVRIGL